MFCLFYQINIATVYNQVLCSKTAQTESQDPSNSEAS